MVINFCTKVIEKLPVKPDKIYLGSGFHKDMERLGQSIDEESPQFCMIGDIGVYLDRSLQGRRVKIAVNGEMKTFNYKTFIRKDSVEF